eukprot:6199950-Pleurochrysis_carterae.AAC.1
MLHESCTYFCRYLRAEVNQVAVELLSSARQFRAQSLACASTAALHCSRCACCTLLPLRNIC